MSKNSSKKPKKEKGKNFFEKLEEIKETLPNEKEIPSLNEKDGNYIPEEEWKDVVTTDEYLNSLGIYQISSLGRARSKDRYITDKNGFSRHVKSTYLKTTVNNNYIMPRVTFTYTLEGKQVKRCFSISLLFVKTFIDSSVQSMNDFVEINEINDVIDIKKYWNVDNFIINKGYSFSYEGECYETSNRVDLIAKINEVTGAKITREKLFDKKLVSKVYDKDLEAIVLTFNDIPGLEILFSKKRSIKKYEKNSAKYGTYNYINSSKRNEIIESRSILEDENLGRYFKPSEIKRGLLSITRNVGSSKFMVNAATHLLKQYFSDVNINISKNEDKTEYYIKKRQFGKKSYGYFICRKENQSDSSNSNKINTKETEKTVEENNMSKEVKETTKKTATKEKTTKKAATKSNEVKTEVKEEAEVVTTEENKYSSDKKKTYYTRLYCFRNKAGEFIHDSTELNEDKTIKDEIYLDTSIRDAKFYRYDFKNPDEILMLLRDVKEKTGDVTFRFVPVNIGCKI